ncbi:acyltransferase [Flammeovirga sp. SJP92]|uniref:acyltransferase family protein n=1 Tax=Flammeovirga sp. SJP92 TaxID=1775430 RepID=UPI0007888758|nr:acyltransferase [Flammeovirga sp. SJP92]KXX66837.1 hypothetical protein AVL50_30360 [Flammeovirga sp. SJP92]
MGKQYISSLTALRGIAAIWIVFFHIDVCTYYRDLGSVISRESSGILSKGYLWVDFFFILSGFIIYHIYGATFKDGLNLTKVKSFVWNRFAKIYPLHIITLLLLIGASELFGHYYPWLIDDSWKDYFSYDALPSQIFMFNAMDSYHFLSWNMPSWSIGAEWWTYILSILFLGFMSRQKLASVIITSILAFSGLCALVYLHPNHNLDITWDYGFVRCLFQFILGVNLYYFYSKKTGYKFLSRDNSFWVLFILIPIGFHNKFHDLFFVPIFVLLILAAAYNRGKVRDLLEFPIVKVVGEISYSIYMMHTFVFFFFWFVLPHWKEFLHIEYFTPIEHFSIFSSFTVMTILLAIPANIYIELKLKRWLTNTPKKEEEQIPIEY